MFRYRAWDGTQSVEALSPERVLTGLSDALLSGTIEQALDRALHRGLTTDDGERLTGLDALRDQLRAERRALERQIAAEEQLRERADALKAGAAGGETPAGLESSRLLESLSVNPSGTEIALDRLDPDRLAGQASVERPRRGSGTPEGTDFTAGESSSGSLDDVIRRLEALDELETALRRIRHVINVGEIDLDVIRKLLGDRAADAWATLAASLEAFAQSGFVRGPEGKVELSARALQIIGDDLLAVALQRMTVRQGGDRVLPNRGQHELTGSTREYQFGDPLALDLSRTVLHAVRRGGGLPVRLDASDFAIFDREDTARAATVLAIDLSRSMGERGYLLAARKLALALTTLVRTRFPRDRMLLVGFSESARPVEARDLPQLTWDRFGFGTNVQDALRLSRNILGAHRGLQRNLILLTDGEPTAHRDHSGTVRFSHPPSAETIAATLAEGERLRRDGIQLGICVLSNELQVVRFAEQLCERAAGELLVTAPDDLAAAVVLRYGQRRRSH